MRIYSLKSVKIFILFYFILEENLESADSLCAKYVSYDLKHLLYILELFAVLPEDENCLLSERCVVTIDAFVIDVSVDSHVTPL
jgi:hypothetical protein